MTARDLLREAARAAVRRADPALWSYLSLRPVVRQVLPDSFDRLDPEDYIPEPVALGAGVDLRATEQLALLSSWEGRFESLFARLRAEPQINTRALGRPYLHNGYYPTPDAEVYAAMIADRRPAKIVEIGAGFSTRIARTTIDELASGTELIVVDPEPRADVSRHAHRVLQRRIEDVDLRELGVDERTLVFIDSSHVIRAGGDVPLLFCRVIPDLPPGVLVHVHDIFLPYDYPPAYLRRLYNEAYVLWALLARGSMCRVLFATHFMVRTQLAAMRRTFGPGVGADNLYFGASFWFQLT